MHGSQLLRNWRMANGYTQTQAARIFGFSQACVCDYERGRILPNIRYGLIIEVKTKGEVPIASWSDSLRPKFLNYRDSKNQNSSSSSVA